MDLGVIFNTPVPEKDDALNVKYQNQLYVI